VADTFNAQGVANTLWAYATMGREPGSGMMRALEGRAEAVAGTFNTQVVVNSGKLAVSVRDDGAFARGRSDEGNGGAA